MKVLRVNPKVKRGIRTPLKRKTNESRMPRIRNKTKKCWFPYPIQLLMRISWWSNRTTHLSQLLVNRPILNYAAQWQLRRGRLIPQLSHIVPRLVPGTSDLFNKDVFSTSSSPSISTQYPGDNRLAKNIKRSSRSNNPASMLIVVESTFSIYKINSAKEIKQNNRIHT